MLSDAPIILFHYPFSPWARKVTAYLALRGDTPYTEVHAPLTQPRPDFDALGLKYRRIPVMAIGRDIYCDTLIMLEKLEELLPAKNSLAAKNNTDRALERMFEKWTDVVVFKNAAEAIPTHLDAMQDPTFQNDREELWGRSWKPETQDALIPPALANIRDFFVFLEDILSDGRTWILNNDKPLLADIHGESSRNLSTRSLFDRTLPLAIWIFDWLIELGATGPEELISEKIYPKTFAYRNRIREAIAKAKETAPKVTLIEGKEAIELMKKSGFGEKESTHIENDPVKVSKGQEVEAWPADTGFSRKEKGKLIAINHQEMVIETTGVAGDVRVHYPRWNFKIEPAGGLVNGAKA